VTITADPAIAPEERSSDRLEPRAGRQEPATPSKVAGWSIAAIRAYQLARSGRPTGCRYLPTCSEYAIEAIEVHGLVRGVGLAARRLMRCNPWGGHGVDPVPHRRSTCTHH
jgi:putative membrane protein insertion efficiency factor